MTNHIRDFPVVQLVLIVVAGIFAAEVIHEIATGEIWWPF
jgi:hypothetical protein